MFYGLRRDVSHTCVALRDNKEQKKTNTTEDVSQKLIPLLTCPHTITSDSFAVLNITEN